MPPSLPALGPVLPARRASAASVPPTRRRTAAAIAVVVGLLALVVPLAGEAANAAHPVAFTVRIDDGTDSAALAGARVTVRSSAGEGPVVAAGTTGVGGTVTLHIAGEPGLHMVEATWPGAPGDLESDSSRQEFYLGSGNPVETLTLLGTFGSVSGTIAAVVDGQPMADISAAALSIASGGEAVQRVTFAGDGSFTSTALPTTATADYSVSFVPPSGYALAAGQPVANPAFALPRGTSVIRREFALLSSSPTATPTPTPKPTSRPTPKPTAAPTPTRTPSPDPTATLAPGPIAPGPTATSAPSPSGPLQVAPRPPLADGGSVPLSLPTTDQSLGAALVDTSGTTPLTLLEMLLASAADSRGQTLPLFNERGELIGLAQQPVGPLSAEVTDALAPLVPQLPGVTVTSTALIALDLEAAMEAAQAARMDSLAAQLAAAAQGNGRVDAAALDKLSALSKKRNEASEMMAEYLRRMQEAQQNILGVMRSTPVSLGEVQLDGESVTGSFDLSQVPDGEHHLILNYPDAGVTIVSNVTVKAADSTATAAEPALIESGVDGAGEGLGVGAWIAAGFLVLGVATAIGLLLVLRRSQPA